MEAQAIKSVTVLAMAVLTALASDAAYGHMAGPHAGQSGVLAHEAPIVPSHASPEPGSYRLPAIQQAVDGNVLDSRGRKRTLFDVMRGRSALLSFIYTNCHVPGGCPLALGILNEVRNRIADDPTLSNKVVLITLSFDPENDTPAAMRKLAEAFDAGEFRSGPPWHFLTTPSRAALRPILDGYGQYVVRETDSAGRYTGGYSHVLKVFLVDSKKRVRNIYSTSFLEPDLVIGDIKTLFLEIGGAP